HHDRDVVALGVAAAEALDVAEERVADVVGSRVGRAVADDGLDPLDAVRLAGRALRLVDAVGVEDEEVAGGHRHLALRDGRGGAGGGTDGGGRTPRGGANSSMVSTLPAPRRTMAGGWPALANVARRASRSSSSTAQVTSVRRRVVSPIRSCSRRSTAAGSCS